MNSSLTPFEHTPPPQQVTNDQAKKPTSLEEKRGTSRGAGGGEDDSVEPATSEGPDDDGTTELAFYAGFRVEHRHVITAPAGRRRWITKCANGAEAACVGDDVATDWPKRVTLGSGSVLTQLPPGRSEAAPSKIIAPKNGERSLFKSALPSTRSSPLRVPLHDQG
ncbi:hypothetical protein BGW80DRAFT_1447232 [Lactifluus volemus]|nr:hypothetical protein BGW80DRAFT_1447232 [Lactifluus volemus]